VQHSDERLRINVQLVDAQNGAHLWADRFDRDRSELFNLQDEIVARLARELDQELIAIEARRAERAPSSDALDLFVRGWAAFNRAHNPVNLVEAGRLFESALKLDPAQVDALVGRAMVKYVLAATYVSDDRSAHLAAAEADATKALTLAPNHARAHAVLGSIYTTTDRPELGITQAERALALDPSFAPCHAGIGWAKVMLGRAAEAEADIAHALRISPRDTFAYGWCYMAGTAKLLLGRADEAVVWLRRSVEANHGYPIAHFTLAAALALSGKAAEAQAAAAAAFTLSPRFTVERYRAGLQGRNPTYLAQRERIYEGLRKAGVPERIVDALSLASAASRAEPPASQSPSTLSQSGFAAALKEALRDYTRPDLLASNPLLHSSLMAQSACAEASELKQLLSRAVETLFASPRDEKLRRVIELTYFRPAPKQEAVAERLGVPFGTYRRHLTTALSRLTKWLFEQEREGHRAERTAAPAAATELGEQPATLRERLSIAVLPFLNLSQDEAVDYLVDGIADGLMTNLSRALPGSFVISRSTAFTYRGRQMPVRQVGRELNVRYVLEGSMLADATRIRVNAQLVDAKTEEQRWAERFDKERRDVLQLHDEIVARLSRSIGIEMIRSEAARPLASGSGRSDAVDLAMRGHAVATDIRRKENAAEAVRLFRQALALDPDNVEALVGLATTCNFQVLNLYETEKRDELLAEAESLIERALTLAPDHIGVLKAYAVLRRARGRFSEAIVAIRAVIELNPGEPTAYRELGLNKLYLGETREAADWFRRADSIAPRDLERWTWLQGLGRALMQIGENANAVEVLRLALDNNPNHRRGWALLAAAEALAGDMAAAKLHIRKFAELDPGMTVRKFAEQRSSVPLNTVSPVYLSENERIFEGLRLAGMPV
jgi:TolB-like protein/Flp pilus assembly protein TadD